jgi:hypothetical protein
MTNAGKDFMKEPTNVERLQNPEMQIPLSSSPIPIPGILLTILQFCSILLITKGKCEKKIS